MNRQSIRASRAFLVVAAVTLATNPTSAQDASAQTVAQANNQIAFELFAELREGKSAEENVLVSPVSISTALAMTYAGARDDTADQMASVLHFAGLGDDVHAGYGNWLDQLNAQHDEYQLSVANRLFGEQGMLFKQPFLDTLANTYGAPLESVNFVGAPDESRLHINGWVADNTNDRIQDLLPPGSIDELTRLVLANAVYLNAPWLYPFDESMTQDRTFHRSDGTTMETPTMMQTQEFRYGEFDGYSVLEMPYEGDNLSMVVVLPAEIDGITDVEARLTAESLQSNIDSLNITNLRVSLPAFRFRDEFSLRDQLISLGMEQAFLPTADFSGLADDDRLHLSDVFHKTFIDVTEKGTEAAAATGVVFVVTSAPPPPIPFTVDHPFLFAIRDTNTDGLLFLGRVAEPSLAIAVPEPRGFGLALLGLLFVCVGKKELAHVFLPQSLTGVQVETCKRVPAPDDRSTGKKDYAKGNQGN